MQTGASNPIRLRTQYVIGDLSDIVRIENECFPPLIAYSREALHNHFHSPDSIFFLAENDTGLIGFIFGDMKSRKPCGYIESLNVQVASRGKEVGTQLLQAIESAFQERGAHCARLEVQVTNTPAINLYRKNGYHSTKTIPNFYADRTAALELFKGFGNAP